MAVCRSSSLQSQVLRIPIEAEKIKQDGGEAAGIHRVARLVHSRWQLAGWKLNRALHQIVREEAGFQCGHHYQDRSQGQHRRKMAVGQKSF